MARAFLPIGQAALLLAAVAAASPVAAGGIAKEGERKTTNSFNLLYNTTTAAPGSPVPSPNGVGLGPSKAVLSNPYSVPLIQNAGSLRSGR